jgi:hypothetical protein
MEPEAGFNHLFPLLLLSSKINNAQLLSLEPHLLGSVSQLLLHHHASCPSSPSSRRCRSGSLRRQCRCKVLQEVIIRGAYFQNSDASVPVIWIQFLESRNCERVLFGKILSTSI